MKNNSLSMQFFGKKEWGFKEPKQAYEASQFFYDGTELINTDNNKARKLFEKALSVFPEHIDSIVHLALMSKSKEERKEMLEIAISTGERAFDKKFDPKKHQLSWLWLENRPFLRAYHSMGLEFLKEENTEKATEYFKQILSWNPNDNQGIRYILADIYVKQEKWEKIIELCKKYPDDAGPSITYSNALALFKTGKKNEAEKAIKEAIEYSPLCAKELLKTKHVKPKSAVDGYITMGGADEAFEFWETQGKSEAWQKKEVKEWLLENVKKQQSEKDKRK